MKLLDAMKAGRDAPDTPLPIRAGRCEAPSGNVLCGAPASWWVYNQFRCGKHKERRTA